MKYPPVGRRFNPNPSFKDVFVREMSRYGVLSFLLAFAIGLLGVFYIPFFFVDPFTPHKPWNLILWQICAGFGLGGMIAGILFAIYIGIILLRESMSWLPRIICTVAICVMLLSVWYIATELAAIGTSRVEEGKVVVITDIARWSFPYNRTLRGDTSPIENYGWRGSHIARRAVLLRLEDQQTHESEWVLTYHHKHDFESYLGRQVSVLLTSSVIELIGAGDKVKLLIHLE